MVLNGIEYVERYVTPEEAAVVDKMREEEANPYDRIELLEDIIRDIAYAHDNIKCLQADIGNYIRKM